MGPRRHRPVDTGRLPLLPKGDWPMNCNSNRPERERLKADALDLPEIQREVYVNRARRPPGGASYSGDDPAR